MKIALIWTIWIVLPTKFVLSASLSMHFNDVHLFFSSYFCCLEMCCAVAIK